MRLSRLMRFPRLKRPIFLSLAGGFALGLLSVYFVKGQLDRTSTNEYCESCHLHPQATKSWKEGLHYRNPSGVVTNCIDCHLPPSGWDHYWEKGKAGARDLYGYLFKDPSSFDWEAISVVDEAVHYTFDSACSRCHRELFPFEITKKGLDAHIHYQKNLAELRCVNCHLKSGHFHEDSTEADLVTVEAKPVERDWAPLLDELPEDAFEDYSAVLPGSGVKFEMVAVEGGRFFMGSPEDDPQRQPDESPQPEVEVGSFWMGKFEVSWQEFEVYYAQTATRGKNESGAEVDAITGPTPPYGSPDQGWGRGLRPAITMTHYAARKYCEWLSEVTGQQYRLPTEAEWEYAARGGSPSPYFFQTGEASSGVGAWFNRLLGSPVDETVLDQYAWYATNSKRKTYPPETKQPNPLGIFNMMGNVREFCLDWYSPDYYSRLAAAAQPALNPRGPDSGEEHVVRGGSYKSDPQKLRSSARDHTEHDAWLRTDPQSPKSVWWYSDSNDVGFRIVRVYSKD